MKSLNHRVVIHMHLFLSSRSLMISYSETKTVDVTLIHTWQQEKNELQLKNRVNDV